MYYVEESRCVLRVLCKYIPACTSNIKSEVWKEKEKAIELMGPHDFPFADLIFRTPGVLMTRTGFEAVIVLLYSCAPVTRIMGILRSGTEELETPGALCHVPELPDKIIGSLFVICMLTHRSL